MNLLVCIYRVLNETLCGGGNSRTKCFVPLYDGLRMYCFIPKSVAPEANETMPDCNLSLGKSVWSRTYHEPRQYEAHSMPVATWYGRVMLL